MRVNEIRVVRKFGMLASGCIIALALSMPHLASAWDSQVSAVACSPQTSTGTWGVLSGELRNMSTTSQLQFVCPYDSSSGRKHYNATFLSVNVHDVSPVGDVRAQACARESSGTSVVCGLDAQTSGTPGFVALFPSLSAWDIDFYSWYTYVIVTVPRGPGSGVWSGFQGIYVSGT